MAGLFRTMNELLSRAALAARAGMQFGGDRDLYQVFGYKTNPTYQDFVVRYVRQDVARRIVEAPVDAIWTNPPKVTIGGNDEVWKTLVQENNLWTIFRRADVLARLGRYSVLLVGYAGSGDLKQTINKNRAKNIIYFAPYSEEAVGVAEFNTDPTDPKFAQPKMYRIKAFDPTTAKAAGALNHQTILPTRDMDVNASRCLHIVENPLENNVFGTPALSHIVNLLDDLMKIAGGSAEMFWLSGRQGLHVNVDKDMDLADEDAANLADEIEEYSHQLRRAIRTRGVDINPLKADFADPRGAFSVNIALLSGATGIPQRILLGSEAGQLASEQDRANWADRIDERRANHAEPNILRPFIKMQQELGVLPEGQIEIDWPSAFKMSPLEAAQTSAQNARSAVNFSRQPQFGNITSLEEAREFLGLPPQFPEGHTQISAGDDDDARDTDPLLSKDDDDDDEEEDNITGRERKGPNGGPFQNNPQEK